MKYRYQPWCPDVYNKCEGQEGRIPKLEATNTFRILETIKVFTDLGNIHWRTVPVTLRKLHAHVMSTREGGTRTACNTSIKQGRQCTYNATTFRRVRAPTAAVEKPWVLHNLSVCICSLSYPSCNAHAPYCQLCPAPLYNIFPHYLINGTIFEKKNYWT
jgi:hypothetical protein